MAQALVQKGDDPKSILYISLDHPLLKLLSLREILSLFHESTYPDGRPATLLLDEIQYAPQWETEIKLLVDHKPQYRILATGSASVVHRDRLAESGVGRWITVPIPTLSFFEFVSMRNQVDEGIKADLRVSALFSYSTGDLSALATRMRPLQPLFQRYLLVGGFPETVSQENIDLCQRLLREDVVERVLKRDMTALFGVRNINDLEKLFIYLCLHTGGILAHQSCAKDLGTTATTVANHLLLLEQANLIYRLPFEVKYKAKPQLDKKSGLGMFCASENPKQGYLVTQQEADFGVTRLKGIDTTFLKIPAYILCYLLGQSERLLWG
jgi:uncharacterized protein